MKIIMRTRASKRKEKKAPAPPAPIPLAGEPPKTDSTSNKRGDIQTEYYGTGGPLGRRSRENGQFFTFEQRPFWDGGSGYLPKPQIVREIGKRAGFKTHKKFIASLVPAEDWKEICAIHGERRGLDKKIGGTTWEKVRYAFKASRAERVAKHSTVPLVIFETEWAAALEKRKMLKRARQKLVAKARPVLVRVAQRLEAAARKILLDVEAEQKKQLEAFGIAADKPSQLLVIVGRACWAPSIIATGWAQSPRTFLRELDLLPE
jgi:hypothetical protein